MTNKRGTKHALLMSALALMLCVSMLVGSTYAWFTDSVTSNGNKIQSGTLKLDLEVLEDGTWTSIKEDKTALFDYDKWEPGYVEVKLLKVENEGTLALKWYAKFISDGALSELANVIDVYVLPYGVLADDTTVTYPADRDLTGYTKVGTVAEFVNTIETTTKGTLKEREAAYLGIALKMQESAGNEYQDKTLGEFDIMILATQNTVEADSFDDQYDASSEYDKVATADIWDGTADTSWYNDTDTEFTLTSAEQLAGLAQLVDDGNTFEGKTLKLEENLDLYLEDANGEPISFEPIGSFSDNKAFEGTFDGQGYTVSNMYQNGWALENGYWDGDEYGMGFFSLVENAVVKNVNFDGASLPSEANIMGVVAGGAANCVFENINITDAYLGNHSWYSGGVIGWAEGNVKLTNCNIDANSVVSSQWGDFNNANGGLIGGIDSTSNIYLKDCDVACVIDAYSDVTSAYEWYSYRNCGMLIGDSGQVDDPDGDRVGNAIAPNLTCENVTVTYGEWANYHYCEFSSSSYPFCRVESGESTGAYGNARVGEYYDADGNKVVDDNHAHNADEKHNELIVFDQLYGGESGDRYCTYGTATHDGVTVIYNNK